MTTYYTDKVTKDRNLAKPKVKEYTLAGLAAADKALAINPAYAESMVFKNILMRVQANDEPNLAKRNDLIKEADALLAKAQDLMKQQQQGKEQQGKKGGDR